MGSTFTFASLSAADSSNGILNTEDYAYVDDGLDLDGGDGFGPADDASNGTTASGESSNSAASDPATSGTPTAQQRHHRQW